MSGNTLFFANEPLFNTLVARYVEANRSAFGGSKPVPMLGIEFVFGLDEPPTAQLGPQPGGGNIALKFDKVSLAVYAYQNNQRGELKNTLPVQVTVTGTLGLNGQNITLTGLKATGNGKLDEKAAAMMNETMIPQFQSQVGNIPLPDFTKVIGMPVQLTGLQVEGNQVQAFAQIGGSGDLPTFPSANPDFPAITAAISSGVINELAASQFPGANANVGDRSSNWLGEFEASAGAGADRPQVYIANNTGVGSINVSVHAGAGFKPNLPFADWARPGISISTRTPPLNLRLVNTGKSIIVKVYMDGNVTMDFGLPSPLDKVADGLLSIIRPLANAITGAINSGLDQININAFTLPDNIPGTNLPATLSFADAGFKGNSVQAVIRIG